MVQHHQDAPMACIFCRTGDPFPSNDGVSYNHQPWQNAPQAQTARYTQVQVEPQIPSSLQAVASDALTDMRPPASRLANAWDQGEHQQHFFTSQAQGHGNTTSAANNAAEDLLYPEAPALGTFVSVQRSMNPPTDTTEYCTTRLTKTDDTDTGGVHDHTGQGANEGEGEGQQPPNGADQSTLRRPGRKRKPSRRVE